jgi:2-aminobenzoate-CoA ligase
MADLRFVETAETAHVDTFARDNLPPRALWPDIDLSLAGLDYPRRLNAAAELLDRSSQLFGDRPAIRFPGGVWSYHELRSTSNRTARVLTEDLGLVPGNRVLLRGPNTPMLAACWFAVLKAGGICVATMTLLRPRELVKIGEKAQVRLALADAAFARDMEQAAEQSGRIERVVRFNTDEPGSLDALMAEKPDHFENVATAADDAAIIAFTSGTTGDPKGATHFHRDLLATCDTYGRHILNPQPDDIFCGSPPLAFTFGLGILILFPMRFGASTLLLESARPPELAQAIQDHRVTVCGTAPTAYRFILDQIDSFDLSSLRACVSAGETLPKGTYEAWKAATGVDILDGIGSTEMLHIFISAGGVHPIRPGSTGKPVPGYEARVLDEQGGEAAPGAVGRLGVRGPTGCRYLANEVRQREYVDQGWNLTGDAYMRDEDGYFWFQARVDDMIISSGYNIAGPEVEAVLLEHPAVAECGVVGVPDEERGQIVKAFVVVREGHTPSENLIGELQDFVKANLAPYKYPRAVAFLEALPRTGTGKLQRFKLREIDPP